MKVRSKIYEIYFIVWTTIWPLLQFKKYNCLFLSTSFNATLNFKDITIIGMKIEDEMS